MSNIKVCKTDVEFLEEKNVVWIGLRNCIIKEQFNVKSLLLTKYCIFKIVYETINNWKKLSLPVSSQIYLRKLDITCLKEKYKYAEIDLTHDCELLYGYGVKYPFKSLIVRIISILHDKGMNIYKYAINHTRLLNKLKELNKNIK